MTSEHQENPNEVEAINPRWRVTSLSIPFSREDSRGTFFDSRLKDKINWQRKKLLVFRDQNYKSFLIPLNLA